jgi:DNA-binding CsgD family transcriptional regulator
VSDRLPVVVQPFEDNAPDASLTADFVSLEGFDYNNLAQLDVWVQARSTLDTPPWQLDAGFSSTSVTSPRTERHQLIKSMSQLGHVGVIIEGNCDILEGTSGWVSHVTGSSTIRLVSGKVRLVSPISQNDFERAVCQLCLDPTAHAPSVLLRDLDGWGTDLLQLAAVGPDNPNCVVLTLPKSNLGVKKVVAGLSDSLGLNRREIMIATMLFRGQVDTEIANELKLELVVAKKAIAAILRKFCVRRRSDFVRLFARLP